MKTFYAIAVALAAFAGAAAAQEQQSFKTIIGKGYEIKSVTFARGESTDNREIFLVTLQKESHARRFQALRRALSLRRSPRDGRATLRCR